MLWTRRENGELSTIRSSAVPEDVQRLREGLTVSAVICAYTEERWPLLVRSVASVLYQRRQPLELIVCVDHNDILLERCKREWGQGAGAGPVPVVVIANRYEGRLGSARNSALEIAAGDIVAFLDDDARAAPEWLGRLLAPYGDEGVVAVGGAPLPEFEGHRPRWFPFEFDWVFGCAYAGLPESQAVLARLIGANMSARREALASIGGFHSDNHDDMDMCHRLVHMYPDARIVYEPAALVQHHVPEARTTWSYFWRRCYFVNKGKVEAFSQMEAAASLSADFGFVGSALTRGVPRALGQVLRGDLWGAARAAAIVVGIILAGVGHLAGQGALLVGRGRRRRRSRDVGESALGAPASGDK
jgi:cellulose synthase/poly-beta-1,6-N-acetylglucosamine synthase-like glycosyltransferase